MTANNFGTLVGNKKQILYLASGSVGRAGILKDAKIPFTVHRHFSREEEEFVFKNQNPVQFVTKIAKDKIAKVILPEEAKSYSAVFVLVADTLVFTKKNELLSKPMDKRDAIRMLKLMYQEPVDVVTVAILDKKSWDGQQWNTVSSEVLHQGAEIFWQLPEAQIEFYLADKDKYLTISGAADIEQVGAQYLKWIKGCYWSVMGLPIFSVREALEKQGFLSKDRL